MITSAAKLTRHSFPSLSQAFERAGRAERTGRAREIGDLIELEELVRALSRSTHCFMFIHIQSYICCS